MEADERFSHIARDPRFKKIPSQKRKVKIDLRFQQMFTDTNFNTKYFVDKRGRKANDSAVEDLTNFYQVSNDNEEVSEESENEEKKNMGSVLEADDASYKRAPKRKRKSKQWSSTTVDKKERRAKARGGVIKEDERKSFLTADEEMENESNVYDNWLESEARAPITKKSTKRLAVCNMDWDKITANDLFILFHSFLSTGQTIHSVKIYPSDYGLEKLRREDESGPTDLSSFGNMPDDDTRGNADENYQYNQEKLRQYQLNRLRYYYAVVECDCPETAEKIYEECDGLEYEASSSQVDLRFIPKDMVFDHEPTSAATMLLSAENYKPTEFITTALQQSTVRFTWDETDPKRVQTTMKNFSKDDLLDMDFRAYLASSSSENETDVERDEVKNSENQENKIAKCKALLEQIRKQDKESENENEMEVLWDVGLKETTENLVRRKKSEKEQKQLTPWENYLDDKKCKKRMKQLLKRNKNGSPPGALISDDELPADVDLNYPYFAQEYWGDVREKSKNGSKKRKRKSKHEESEEDKRKKAELQLLMMEEDDGKKHFNLKSIIKNEIGKKTKKCQKLTGVGNDDFEIDVNDRRFSALYLSHHFAVDPSDQQFRKTKAMESIIREKQRRVDSAKQSSGKKTDSTLTSDKKKVDLSLSALVKTVKSNVIKYNHKRRDNTRKRSKHC